MMVSKMIFLFQGCILRFHVNLPGCMSFQKKGSQQNGDLSWDVHEEKSTTPLDLLGMFWHLDPPRLKYFEVMRCSAKRGALNRRRRNGMSIGTYCKRGIFRNRFGWNLRLHTPLWTKRRNINNTNTSNFCSASCWFFEGCMVHFCYRWCLAMNVTLVWGSVPSCSWDQIHDCYSIVYLGGGVLNMFYFHPENWGRWTQFDEHIFQMGWFNHQPGTESSL